MISRRRLPSPGHISLREEDEKEYKRPRLTGGQILGPGGIGPSWTWPRSGGMDPAGTLGGVEIPILSRFQMGKGEQAQYTPDPEHLYLNATVFGKALNLTGTSGVSPTSSVPATFDQTYDKVLLRKPSDFKMAVVRFQVPVSSVPIFYYPIGSCSVGISVGGVIYPKAAGGVVQGQEVVVVQSADPSSDLPGPPPGSPAGTIGPVPGYPLGAIAVWNLQQFIEGVNDAIYQVTAKMWQDQQAHAANGWLGSPPGGPSLTFPGNLTSSYSNIGPARGDGEFAPHITYDPVTGLCSIAYEQDYWHAASGGIPTATYVKVWGQRATATPDNGTANLYFNYNLYQTFFSTFPGFYTQSIQRTLLPTGLDVQILLKQKDQYQHPVEGMVVALNSFAGNSVVYVSAVGGHTITWTNQNVAVGVEVGDIVLVSGINSDTAANGAYTIVSVTDAHTWHAFNTSGLDGKTFVSGGGAGGTDQPSFIRIPRWSQLPGQINVMTQETQTVSTWTSFTSLRLITFSVPVRPEYVPTSAVNPSGPGQQNPSGFFVQQTIQQPTGQYVTSSANSNAGLTQQGTQTGTSTVNTQTIMIDFLPEDTSTLVTRDYISYTSRENYRWIDLIGDNPLQRFDVMADWVDRFGNAYPLTVAPNEVFDCKFLIQHKYS